VRPGKNAFFYISYPFVSLCPVKLSLSHFTLSRSRSLPLSHCVLITTHSLFSVSLCKESVRLGNHAFFYIFGIVLVFSCSLSHSLSLRTSIPQIYIYTSMSTNISPNMTLSLSLSVSLSFFFSLSVSCFKAVMVFAFVPWWTVP
jgi:hypothetical protein